MVEHDYEQLITVFTDTENVDAFHLSKSQKEAIRHALEQCARMERDNLVLVPKAPSEPMIDAALEYTDGYNSKYFLGLYRAMIQAAQTGERE